MISVKDNKSSIMGDASIINVPAFIDNSIFSIKTVDGPFGNDFSPAPSTPECPISIKEAPIILEGKNLKVPLSPNVYLFCIKPVVR